jgi:hypothetical protein
LFTWARMGSRGSSATIPDELPARGDPMRTGQIFAVLIDNAVRYTPARGRIVVEGRLRDGRTETSVADPGPVIAPGQLPRVFDRFYRAKAARTRVGGGTDSGWPLRASSHAPRAATLWPRTAQRAERWSAYAYRASEAILQVGGTGRQPVCPPFLRSVEPDASIASTTKTRLSSSSRRGILVRV